MEATDRSSAGGAAETGIRPPALADVGRSLTRSVSHTSQNPEHRDWSIFEQLTVRFAFGRKLTFRGMKRYVTVGQLRELVAQELLLPAAHVALRNAEDQLASDAMLLEDALGDYVDFHMVRCRNFPAPVLVDCVSLEPGPCCCCACGTRPCA